MTYLTARPLPVLDLRDVHNLRSFVEANLAGAQLGQIDGQLVLFLGVAVNDDMTQTLRPYVREA